MTLTEKKNAASNNSSLLRNEFTELLHSNDRGDTLTQRHKRPTILLLFHVFVAGGTCLLNCCLETIGEDTHTDPQTDGRDL
jgi:hypothetical protein